MKVVLPKESLRYVLEQSLLAYFPEERPVYEEILPTDTRWVKVTATEENGCYAPTVEIGYGEQRGSHTLSVPLSGTDYEQEGQRRRGLSLCFFHAVKKTLSIHPPWGSLIGIRPVKVATELLEGGHTEEETAHILKETYCVSEERLALCMDAARQTARADEGHKETDISLYVGIPFCPTRCAYCSFVSNSIEKSLHLIEPYLELLEQEIVAASRMVKELGLTVKSFYMGGGTPTTLSASQMDRLLTTLEQHFDFPALLETTVEAGRPDTITEEKLRVLKNHAISRISVNPQTMEDSVLQVIGRHHTARDIEDTMELVSRIGFAHVNMDLIAGLPSDTVEGFQRSLDKVIAFGTDNLTVHTLSLKKGSRITLEGTRLPTVSEVGAMLDDATGKLRQAAFSPYYLYRQKYQSGSFENVGWCKEGGEGLYNIYIMEELHGILSLGGGGSTKMVDRQRNRIERVFNLKYPLEYIKRPEKIWENQQAFAEFYQKKGV